MSDKLTKRIQQITADAGADPYIDPARGRLSAVELVVAMKAAMEKSQRLTAGSSTFGALSRSFSSDFEAPDPKSKPRLH